MFSLGYEATSRPLLGKSVAPRLLNCRGVGRIIDKLSLNPHQLHGDVPGTPIDYAVLKA